jgi:hypothetical protein
MMIEVGKKSEFMMSYDEAVMYCFCLGDGWRLPTSVEYYKADGVELGSWFVGKYTLHTWHVIPVRDLKDD